MRLKMVPELFHRLRVIDRRTLLIALAGLLLLLNLGRFGWQAAVRWQDSIDDRVTLLGKHRKAVRRTDDLRREVMMLERQHATLTSYLFTGNSEEEAASAMQVALQEEVVKAGLEPEFLQPSLGGPAASGQKPGIGAIAIKLRLGGTLNNFAQFIQGLYRSKKLFTIENFTIKPHKKEDLTVYLEIKGYYATPAPGAQPRR